MDSERFKTVDLRQYLKSVVDETNATASQYSVNFSPNTPMHAAPFFGRADVALYATGGLNPSPKEFQNGRWPTTAVPVPVHLNRLLEYFVNPTVPYYKSWFGVWERALECIGRSYFSDAAHFDLSARATVPVSNCPDPQVFVQMVTADIRWFFALLARRTGIQGLFVAGSSWRITKSGVPRSAYLDEIIRRAGRGFGFELAKVRDLRRKSGAKMTLYRLSRPGGDSIPVFFSGASPSSKSPKDLVEAVRIHASLLKDYGL
jgi:hypothetical protein